MWDKNTKDTVKLYTLIPHASLFHCDVPLQLIQLHSGHAPFPVWPTLVGSAGLVTPTATVKTLEMESITSSAVPSIYH